MIVMRQTKIDQHRFAAGTKHDAARLDVVMNDVLPMQFVKRHRDFPGDDPGLVVRQRQIVDPAVERLAGNDLHHDIGLAQRNRRRRSRPARESPTVAAESSAPFQS